MKSEEDSNLLGRSVGRKRRLRSILLTLPASDRRTILVIENNEMYERSPTPNPHSLAVGH